MRIHNPAKGEERLRERKKRGNNLLTEGWLGGGGNSEDRNKLGLRDKVIFLWYNLVL